MFQHDPHIVVFCSQYPSCPHLVQRKLGSNLRRRMGSFTGTRTGQLWGLSLGKAELPRRASRSGANSS